MALVGGLEQYCRQLAAEKSLFESVLMDAVGTALLENCDAFCCERLTAESRHQNLFLGERYAPGTGAYPLSYQRELFCLLAPDRIGVHLNDAYIMSPIKSLTHLTFLTSMETTSKRAYKCYQCLRERCQFRVSVPPSWHKAQ